MSQSRILQTNLSKGGVPKQHPGRARLYARFLSPGRIRTGDKVGVK